MARRTPRDGASDHQDAKCRVASVDGRPVVVWAMAPHGKRRDGPKVRMDGGPQMDRWRRPRRHWRGCWCAVGLVCASAYSQWPDITPITHPLCVSSACTNANQPTAPAVAQSSVPSPFSITIQARGLCWVWLEGIGDGASHWIRITRRYASTLFEHAHMFAASKELIVPWH